MLPPDKLPQGDTKVRRGDTAMQVVVPKEMAPLLGQPDTPINRLKREDNWIRGEGAIGSTRAHRWKPCEWRQCRHRKTAVAQRQFIENPISVYQGTGNTAALSGPKAKGRERTKYEAQMN